jgi:hypothetical protein
MKKKCEHDWHEDPLFKSGAIRIVAGTPKALGEETIDVCSECGERRYRVIKKLGSLVDMYKDTL